MNLDAFIHTPFEGSPWRWVDGLEAFGVEVMRLAALSVTTSTFDAWDASEFVGAFVLRHAPPSLFPSAI